VLAIAARLTAIAAVAVFAGSASAQSTGVGFTLLPKKVVQGEDARVAVSVRPSGTRCTLNVRYQGGTQQPGLGATTATRGRAAWTWHVPTDVQAGPAQTTVRCARAGAVTRSLVIVGRLIEPKIDIVKQGFTIRPNPGAGTRLSYGIILHNEAPERDAMNITVQTNFVMGDNNLLGTDSQHITGIAGGSDYALGRMINFPGSAPITRLEIVVQVEKYVPRALHNATLANIHLVPGLFDQSWVGTVEGELQNTDPALSLQSADLSAVVFDAAGNVLGGGSGFAFQTLPPGAREFIQLSYGLDAIPWERAASTMVSMTSTWKQPGT
jgi:hypothetical protein